ncbi:P-loop containing nucleoside triphosphate hydrolase protein, partial [Gymnopilus junonius]
MVFWTRSIEALAMFKLDWLTRWETLATKKGIIIPVIGPRGVGKSTFINTLLMKVKPTSIASTSALTVDYIETFHGYDDLLKDHRIVIIDTPGFDDTFRGDSETLQKIADLMDKSFKKAELGGVIYLHDISDHSFPGMAQRNLEMLQHLSKRDIVNNVVLGTTKWTLTSLDVGDERQKQLRNVYWKPLLEMGSQIRPFHDSFESAWGFIDDIIASLEERWEAASDPHKDHPQGRSQIPRLSLTTKDIVIHVLGPSGAGKSMFTKTLLAHSVPKEDPELIQQATGLDSKYIYIQPIPGYDHLEDHRIVVVDTPALEGIKATLGGVVYLHDISSDPLTDMTCWNIEINLFERLLDNRARTYRYEDTSECAWGFIDYIIYALEMNKLFKIAQEERKISDTDAGKDLQNTLAEVRTLYEDMGKSIEKFPNDDAKRKLQEIQGKMQKVVDAGKSARRMLHIPTMFSGQ